VPLPLCGAQSKSNERHLKHATSGVCRSVPHWVQRCTTSRPSAAAAQNVAAWSVISGAGDEERAQRAMTSVHEHLVRGADGLVLLFTPPFDEGESDPGYVKGYPPGIRENGGQYTHAAVWAVIAFAMLGRGDLASEVFAILNPIRRASSRAGVHRYKVEPYVACADVYSSLAHVGRGGWTWYTGSAGWMYRVGIETILGVTLHRGALRIDPCIPSTWPNYDVTYRTASAEFRIAVENPDGVCRGVRRVEIDGVARQDLLVPLANVTGTHTVRVVLGNL